MQRAELWGSEIPKARPHRQGEMTGHCSYRMKRQGRPTRTAALPLPHCSSSSSSTHRERSCTGSSLTPVIKQLQRLQRHARSCSLSPLYQTPRSLTEPSVTADSGTGH
ncbi:hypothetical protein AAFF_G00086270 [Aldrovandia affinis]|uniref:Uncharacterized protein n=1 Tax=Aldrovandia affinis TaxID=143900 RepID=A0AAD7WC57_9TELE|nr:hypothetical protein AAFF_G00086270 [Aldrovandia affinis]